MATIWVVRHSFRIPPAPARQRDSTSYAFVLACRNLTGVCDRTKGDRICAAAVTADTFPAPAVTRANLAPNRFSKNGPVRFAEDCSPAYIEINRRSAASM